MVWYRKWIFYILALAGVAIIIPSYLYYRSTAKVDSHMFEPSDCVKSCWMGLIVGEASKQDIVLFYSENVNKIKNPSFGQNTFYRGQYRGISIYTPVEYGALSRIWLSAKFNLTIEEILVTIGTPDLVSFDTGGEMRGRLFGEWWEVISILSLYYLDEGYIFRFELDTQDFPNKPSEVCIEKETTPVGIEIYTASETIDDLLSKSDYFDYSSNREYPLLETELNFGCRPVQ